MGDNLCVRFSNRRNSFCEVFCKSMSGKLQQHMGRLVCIKLTTHMGACYLSASQVNSGDNNEININGLYADKLGLSEGDKVYAELIDSPVTVTRVAIEPVSVDDWEILELNAEYVQSDLLNQVRIIKTGLVLPVWVSGNICIFIKVGWMEPEGATCVLLDQLTELVISAKDRRRLLHRKSANNISSQSQKTDKSVSYVTSADKPASQTSTQADKDKPDNRDIQQVSNHSLSERTATNQNRSSLQLNNLQSPTSESGRAAYTASEQNSLYGALRRWLPSFLTPDSSPTAVSYAMATSSHKETVSKQWSAGEVTPVVGRVLSTRLHQRDSWWSKYPSLCVVNRSLVPQANSNLFLADLFVILSPMDLETEAKQAAKFRRRNQAAASNKTEKLIGTVCVVVGDGDDATLDIPLGHVLLDEMFCRLHRIKLTSKVRLQKVACQLSQIATIQIQPTQSLPEYMSKDAISVAFKNYVRAVTLAQGYPLQLLSSNALNIEIAAGKSADFLVLVGPPASVQSPTCEQPAKEKGTDALRYFILHPDNMANINLNSEEIITNRCNFSVVPEGMISPDTLIPSPVGCLDLYERLINFIQSSLHCRSEGALLLTGSRGTGKTTLMNSVLRHMSKHGHCFTHSIDSTQLRGKRSDAIRRLLETTIQECVWRQPTVLFIDDLDTLCKAPSGPEEEASPEIVYSSKISEVLKDRLDSMWRRQVQVVVIASSLSRGSLHPKLVATHGAHLFHLTEDMPSLSQTSRCSMLKSVMSNLEIKVIPPDDQLISHTDKLEGYVVRDLVAVVKRAAHAHTIFTGDNPATRITIEDLDAALEGFTPASLRGVALHSPGSNTWRDVGGLHNIKEQLVRMLEWPAKYRKLYAQCPIRLQSGVLLYGAPGTGKTLVAAVVANEMALNFISIKGPELLNKYIGASEQGVRDTFKRAQNVKPCILFFDEFESLAPRRGHDSTGVTDRVVNQLLTQLDGVEALEGVYVLAATSRPDLIDPALLRPGRLDKSLCCGIPTPDDRQEILQALARHMNIDAEVDLAEVAECCEDCTGADIKSLLVNAQLEAVHDVLDNSILYRDSGVVPNITDEQEELVTGIYKSSIEEEAQPITPQSPCYEQIRRLYSQTSKNTLSRETSTVNDTQVIIKPCHIDSALSSLQPSVSERERIKYQRVYEQFTSSKGSQVLTQPDQLLATKQRVSLA